jgi:hypothetical protein
LERDREPQGVRSGTGEQGRLARNVSRFTVSIFGGLGGGWSTLVYRAGGVLRVAIEGLFPAI